MARASFDAGCIAEGARVRPTKDNLAKARRRSHSQHGSLAGNLFVRFRDGLRISRAHTSADQSAPLLQRRRVCPVCDLCVWHMRARWDS